MRATTGHNAPVVAQMAGFSRQHGVDLRALELDVLSQDPVEAGIARAIADAGRLDVIVHNAGHMARGPAEAFTPEQYARLYDINVPGVRRAGAHRQLMRERVELYMPLCRHSTQVC